MWTTARPSASRVAQFLDAERALPFSYEEVGGSADDRMPAGYAHDHNRERLGAGAQTFATGKDAIRAWKMFPPWTAIEPQVAIQDGNVLGVLVHALGVWFLNSARIVYVIDEPRTFGFAYGTLPGHAERGEERFSVEHLDDDSVWYDVRAFSKPRYWGARVAYPVTRMLQRRFGRDSKAAMLRALR